jgi:hypothetical protein
MTNLSTILIILNLTFVSHIFTPSIDQYRASYEVSKCSPSRLYYSGPKGGCYYINKNGNKTYVSKTCCGGIDKTHSLNLAKSSLNSTSTSDNACQYKGKLLFVGPKGGCYYITPSGNKKYIEHIFCKNC